MITIIRGDRRSGKTHRAIEMAKQSGLSFMVIVPHGGCAELRKAYKGVAVASDRAPNAHTWGRRLYVLDDAHKLTQARAQYFINTCADVILTCPEAMPPWFRILIEMGAVVMDLTPKLNQHLAPIVAVLSPDACRSRSSS